MKHTTVHGCLNIGLLRYLRDRKPTELQFLAWLGPDASAYYVLREAGVLHHTEEGVVLSNEYCTSDGRSLRFGNQIFLIDDDRVITI